MKADNLMTRDVSVIGPETRVSVVMTRHVEWGFENGHVHDVITAMNRLHAHRISEPSEPDR